MVRLPRWSLGVVGSMTLAEEDRDDLRATAESIVASAEDLKEIELRKLELEPEESETRQLAERAEAIAGEIADKARAEKLLADKVADDAPTE